jgi:hypothetical protein
MSKFYFRRTIVAVISGCIGNISFIKPLRLPSLNILKKCNIQLTSMIPVLLTALIASAFHILQTYMWAG